jgi:peptidoglycan hydrolase-like protein with peptidoglycan-binding domain
LRPKQHATKLFAWACAVALVLALGSAPAAAKTKHKSQKHTASSGAKNSKSKAHKGKTAAKKRGQQAIDSDRASEIQSALIREHYLNGEPTGAFDQQTRSALVKFQGDHGWQTKVVPDSRALIKLGLGPDHSKTLNPEALNRPEAARDQVPGGAQERQ